MRHIFTLSILFSILIIFISACDNTVSEISIPAYIEVNEFKLDHENAIGITDVWVNVNGNLVGIFELPAKFPVIANGSSNVILSPGIKVNGVSETRSFYPFYEAYEKTIDLTPSESIVLSPQTTYGSWANIIWKEGFEAGNKFTRHNLSDTTFELSPDEKFEGAFSGAIYMDTSHSFFESYTPELYRPDLAGSPGMYTELNYKCNNPFEIGIYVYYEQELIEKNIVFINSSQEWKKIYIDLYNPLIKYPEGTPYKIYIASYHDVNKMNSSIFIDDFKVIQSSEKK